METYTIIKHMRDESLKALLNSEERLALKVKAIEKKICETWVLQLHRSDWRKTAVETVTEKQMLPNDCLRASK